MATHLDCENAPLMLTPAGSGQPASRVEVRDASRSRLAARRPLRCGSLVWAVMAIGVLLAAPGRAQTTMSYSPLTAIGVGPNGPAAAKIKTEPYCCPSTALVVKANQPVGDADNQWVILGLSVPGSRVGRRITGVDICYEIHAAQPDTTYIWQTRLSAMSTPNVANVVLDDPVKRKGPGPTCYGIKTNINPRGSVTLELKVVFANTQDEIRIGMARLRF